MSEPESADWEPRRRVRGRRRNSLWSEGELPWPVVRVDAQRYGSPAADSGEATKPKNHFSGKVPLPTHAEGGQVQPMLGSYSFSHRTNSKHFPIGGDRDYGAAVRAL